MLVTFSMQLEIAYFQGVVVKVPVQEMAASKVLLCISRSKVFTTFVMFGYCKWWVEPNDLSCLFTSSFF